MKKILATVAMGMVLTASSAFASSFWQGDVRGAGTNFVQDVVNFDWSSSGSGVAQGLGPAGNATALLNAYISQTPFTFRYQANLAAFNNAVGAVIPDADLNNLYEYTINATMTEVVSSITMIPGGAIATFTTLAGAYDVYYDNNPLTFANTAAGTGFNDGTKVVSGTIKGGTMSIFAYPTAPGTGTGSVNEMLASVDFVDTNYLQILLPGAPMPLFRFEATLNYPPLDSTTAQYFDGYVPTRGDINLKVDGSNKYVVPEPSTMILMGIGLVGLVGYRRRMK